MLNLITKVAETAHCRKWKHRRFLSLLSPRPACPVPVVPIGYWFQRSPACLPGKHCEQSCLIETFSIVWKVLTSWPNDPIGIGPSALQSLEVSSANKIAPIGKLRSIILITVRVVEYGDRKRRQHPLKTCRTGYQTPVIGIDRAGLLYVAKPCDLTPVGSSRSSLQPEPRGPVLPLDGT